MSNYNFYNYITYSLLLPENNGIDSLYSDILNVYNEILEEKQFENALTESLNTYKTPEKNPNIKLDMPSILFNKEHKDYTCTICGDEIELNRNIVNLECSHIFHTECISEWIQYKAECPICRKMIKTKLNTESDFYNINFNNFYSSTYNEEDEEDEEDEDDEN